MDKLLLLKGKPYEVTNLVRVNNPTIGEIADFSEENYWGVATQLCSTSFDYRLGLEEMGIDYLTISDWHMFLNSRYLLDYEETKILVPDIDFASLDIGEVNGEIVLANDKKEAVLDERAYTEMVTFIRECHGFKRNFKIPGNKKAREIYMREAREARQYANRRKFKSTLESLISALCNIEGFKYNYDTVWDLSIYNFMDAIKRIPKIQVSQHLMNGMYSGMVDTSKINKSKLNKDLNWMGELS